MSHYSLRHVLSVSFGHLLLSSQNHNLHSFAYFSSFQDLLEPFIISCRIYALTEKKDYCYTILEEALRKNVDKIDIVEK